MELTVALLAGLSICGSGGTGSRDVSIGRAGGSAAPGGIYAGTLQDASGTTENLTGIVDEAGNAAFWDYQTFTSLRFTTRPVCNYFGSTFTAYAGPPGRDFATGGKKTSGFILGAVTPRNGISGTLAFRGGPAASYQVDLLASDYDMPASFAILAGTYRVVVFMPAGPDRVTLNISSSGDLRITDTGGCAYSGFVTVPDSAHNAYDLEATGSCVSRSRVNVRGLAYYTPGSGSQPSTITVIYDNGLDYGVRLVATRQ